MALPHLLRPYPVLFKTVQHLMFEVSNRKDVKNWVLYDFINDRLRAVRQDMTIQRLRHDQCLELLDPMIRFYVYYTYRLCECSVNEYDPYLNKKYLLECLKWFLSCSSTIDKAKGYKQLNDIIHRVSNLDLAHQKTSVDRVLVESLYIICNLKHVQPLYRYLSLPESLRSVSALKLAYDIGVANHNRNFVRVMQLSRRLCPLTYAALCEHLPVLRKSALETMCFAYSSKHLSIPAAVVRDWLMFNSTEEVADFCRHYHLIVENDNVNMNKATFTNAEPPKVKRNNNAKIIRMSLEDVLSYTLQ